MIPPFQPGITVSGSDLAAPAAFTVSDVADDLRAVAEEKVGVVAEPVGSDDDEMEHLRQSRLRLWQKLAS